MRLFRKLPRRGARARPLALAIGVFDGVHLGHQAVLKAAVDLAREKGWTAAALTFDPPPEAALGLTVPARLGHPDEQASVMAGMGVDELYRVPFTAALGRMSPELFCRKVLADGLRCGAVVVGKGFRFGAQTSGTVPVLRALGETHGFTVLETPPRLVGGRPVSSTRLRQAVQAGNLAQAGALLGRPWRLRGVVVRGRQLGRTLGFPTANLASPQESLPPLGVWAGCCRILPASKGGKGRGASRWWGFAGNLGVRPTLGAGLALGVELHLLGYSGALEGRVIEAEFVKRLRGEKKFDSLDALTRQIGKDVLAAKAALKGS